MDKPALLPLPCVPYVFAEWKQATVNIDYHVEVDGHYYSVPCSLIKKRVDIRITATSVECFHKGQRVSGHPRSMQKGRHMTVMEHMPRATKSMRASIVFAMRLKLSADRTAAMLSRICVVHQIARKTIRQYVEIMEIHKVVKINSINLVS